jgi:NAD-dependent DNA ligase
MDAQITKAMRARSLSKAASTLLGICTGIVSDGLVNDLEIHYLQMWLAEHQDACSVWPGNMIARRIEEILSDGVITPDERTSLLNCLTNISGNHFAETGSSTTEAASIPFDDEPHIIFQNRTFCFTGDFYFGTRAACERIVLKLEAMPIDRVTKKLDYLVVGAIGSPNWSQASYGRKIETAIKWQEDIGQPAIISEKHWTAAIEAIAAT